MTPAGQWKQRLEQTPGLRDYLEPVARKWARGAALPKRMTLGDEPQDPAVRAALDRLFGGVSFSKGKVVATLPGALRNEEQLSALATELGIERATPKANTAPASILRLRLTHPHLDRIHDWLADAPEIERLLARDPGKETLLLKLMETAIFLLREEQPTTLSKLGAMFFNDSKILRSGTPRKLLGGIMNARLGTEDTPGNREIALQQFGVIDNPATTTVTLFAPLELIRDGQPDRWIVERFIAGEPVTLNSYNLEGVEAISLRTGHESVITSENAAPFYELVAERPKAILIYTGGYPNAAVCRLLRLLGEAGASCRHWGDTDPDGYLIAALIDRYIDTTLYRCTIDDVMRHKEHLKPLDSANSTRGRRILKTQPRFKFRQELQLTLDTNQWLEQERWLPESRHVRAHDRERGRVGRG
ncbi:hypothetical protein PDESU_06198 [Pontiella desulfatans]|uniref:Wadjet protein JetD C-terminal domain-containing protein n=1 Tax=Pontiella desulfatans TaxID=2750659 RepID=A0A6C2UCG4_PONDE|nr:Wadjet anti-phage system protein JetD domain-containing protein [Pontiella desulfatans]VGO17599.1 hypothetical protein PDESU_06198 [Pontiella desulfatans]